jgi:hypothetical protein
VEVQCICLEADCDKRLEDLQKEHEARFDQLDVIFDQLDDICDGIKEETLHLLDCCHSSRSRDRKVVQTSNELVDGYNAPIEEYEVKSSTSGNDKPLEA